MQKCTLSGVIHPRTVRVHARYGISVCAAGGAALGAAAALVAALPAAPALPPLLHKVISRDHLSARDLSASRTSCFAVLHMKAFPARLWLYISQFHQPFSVSIFMSAYTFLLAGKGGRMEDLGSCRDFQELNAIHRLDAIAPPVQSSPGVCPLPRT